MRELIASFAPKKVRLLVADATSADPPGYHAAERVNASREGP
jgi:hypothetical protein